MDELLRLKENIEKLINADYPDYAVDDMITENFNVKDLNEYIEDELSYAADAEV